MRFNTYSNLAGKHAFLSASKGTWLNYDEEQLERVYTTSMTAQRGTELHAFAAEAIRLGIKLPGSKKTLNQYVNDCLGFRMQPEVTLYYSDNCFGTADAISFRRNLLRIADLKNGVRAASPRQLEIYAALFCLEYNFKPFEIKMELRIYQNDEVRVYEADPEEIVHIMSKIVAFDRRINELREEAYA